MILKAELSEEMMHEIQSDVFLLEEIVSPMYDYAAETEQKTTEAAFSYSGMKPCFDMKDVIEAANTSTKQLCSSLQKDIVTIISIAESFEIVDRETASKLKNREAPEP